MQTKTASSTLLPVDDPRQLIGELTSSLRETAEEVVPWFIEQMPPMYFQDTDHKARLTHLRAILAAKASGQPPKLTLRSEDGRQWTMIRPLDYPGVLADVVHELPTDMPLRAAKIHTAADGRMVLDVFEFGDRVMFDPSNAEQADKLLRTIEYARENAPEWKPAEIEAHFRRCAADYILTLTPLRLYYHWKLFQTVTGTDSATVHLERESDPALSRIVVAVGNSRTRTMLERVAHRLARYAINVHRAYLDLLDDPGNGQVSFLGFVVQGPDGAAIDPSSELWNRLRRDLLRIKWMDDATIRLSDQHAELGLTRAEVVIALCNLVHQVLVKVNPYAFARERLYRLADRHLGQARKIADLFLERFDPAAPMSDGDFEKRARAIRAEFEQEVDPEDVRTMLGRMLDAVAATYRTNVWLDERYALSMRIDPAFMASADREEAPFGVFFIHGRGFNAFHVRFADIARGGVRAVRPAGLDQFAREGERLYDEAYGLAFAQQMKNKDIPEGGAKAVILVEPGDVIARCFKAFGDALLDLITPVELVRQRIVDRFGQPEIIYLGPDENITPEMIVWIVDRARRRGYGLPNSFMSSKPGAGINHKEYGVTSEGVTVFLDVALRAVGIDPKRQPFTVKITGGPDGDVAGNEIRILHREYGENARIVGIADGSGVGEDPDGLNHEELLRLFQRAEPIARFDRRKLGPRGRVVSVDEPDGIQLRNTLHNRLVADAFVPGGGRPRTMHEGNWRQFLQKDGTPSAKVIVEGANIFITPEARRELSDLGVLIFKDSSANKCGVICSSYEIGASMVLTEQEFIANKKRFVAEVLDKLRALARREAELLMREHRRNPQTPMPDTCVRLSRVVIRATDAIESVLSGMTPARLTELRELVIDHLPPVLVEVAGDRLWTNLPAPYMRSLMAASLACRIVYKEGLDFLESMPHGAIADTALRYLRQEHETRRLADEVASSNLPNRRRIAELIMRGGTRAGLGDIEPSD